MILITHEPIDTEAVLRQVQSPRAGAALLFVGTARELTNGRRTEWLEYECYREMAEKKLAELADEARRRWSLCGCVLVHRLGRVEIGEASVAVAVSSPHRHEAFQAGQWLIDTLKEVVPIWKQENYADGGTEWVHPGIESSEAPTETGESHQEISLPRDSA